MMVPSHDTDLDDANFPHLNSPQDGSGYRNDVRKKILLRSSRAIIKIFYCPRIDSFAQW